MRPPERLHATCTEGDWVQAVFYLTFSNHRNSYSAWSVNGANYGRLLAQRVCGTWTALALYSSPPISDCTFRPILKHLDLLKRLHWQATNLLLLLSWALFRQVDHAHNFIAPHASQVGVYRDLARILAP